MNCECAQYEPIELYREEISSRIRQSKKLKKRLEVIAEHSIGEHKLFKCHACGQHWQISRAWNWGNNEYLFKVPEIHVDVWFAEPYVQPDELLIYYALMANYMEKNSFEETERACKTDGCIRHTIKYSVFCLDHHIESLQAAGAFPREPKGKWFFPYLKQGVRSQQL